MQSNAIEVGGQVSLHMNLQMAHRLFIDLERSTTRTTSTESHSGGGGGKGGQGSMGVMIGLGGGGGVLARGSLRSKRLPTSEARAITVSTGCA